MTTPARPMRSRQAVGVGAPISAGQAKPAVSITYRCDPEHHERLRRLCKQRGVDQSTMVRLLMEKALSREELDEFAYRNLFKP